MYTIPKAVKPSPLDLGGDPADPAAAPRLDWRLPRSEQPADQLGSVPEPLLLGRSRAGKITLDLLQHRRQGHRERNEGPV
jgi:hypothetical protein